MKTVPIFAFSLTAIFGAAQSVARTVAHPAPSSAAQAPERTFEVVSIKEVKDPRSGGTIRFPQGRVTMDNVELSMIIEFAYQLKPRGHQLVGLPEWARTTRYEITATYSGPIASPDEVWLMMQRVLEARFGLRAHRETREGQIYLLTLSRSDGRLGPGLVRSDIDCEKWRAEKRPTLGGGSASVLAPGGRRPQCGLIANPPIVTGGGITMAKLAEGLELPVAAPVLERTGLTGAFDVDLDYTRTSELTGAATDGVSIFMAIQEQLGLKLQSARGPVGVLVIDAVTHPTSN